MESQTILFYGRSGSGKGTQAELLKEYIEKNDPEKPVLYIETGSGLRALGDRDLHTAKIVKSIMEEGGLIPVFLAVLVWSNFLVENFTGREHLILDGLGRRKTEVPVLEEALSFYGRTKLVIIIINVSQKSVIKRLLERGRSDDNEEDIKKRLDWYETNVVPAINFFKEHTNYKILEVDGEGTAEEIHEQILKGLGI